MTPLKKGPHLQNLADFFATPPPLTASWPKTFDLRSMSPKKFSTDNCINKCTEMTTGNCKKTTSPNMKTIFETLVEYRETVILLFKT